MLSRCFSSKIGLTLALILSALFAPGLIVSDLMSGYDNAWLMPAHTKILFTREASAAVDKGIKSLQKNNKPKKIETGASPISAKEIKSYSEAQLKSLTKKITELNGKITKSKVIYEKRKNEAWQAYLQQVNLEKRIEKDPDKIIEMHERLAAAKMAEAEALAKYQKESDALAEAELLVKQCRSEIEKADKMLNFLKE